MLETRGMKHCMDSAADSCVVISNNFLHKFTQIDSSSSVKSNTNEVVVNGLLSMCASPIQER